MTILNKLDAGELKNYWTEAAHGSHDPFVWIPNNAKTVPLWFIFEKLNNCHSETSQSVGICALKNPSTEQNVFLTTVSSKIGVLSLLRLNSYDCQQSSEEDPLKSMNEKCPCFQGLLHKGTSLMQKINGIYLTSTANEPVRG